jgi:hypothetical protein
MKQGRAFTIICCLASGLFGSVASSPANGDEPGANQPSAGNMHQVGRSHDPGSDLPLWPGCPRYQSAITRSLCEEGAGRVNEVAYNLIADLLYNDANDQETLCVLDGAVVRSQHRCASPEMPGKSQSVVPMASLMRILALKWERLGELERPDQLFRTADALLEKSDNSLSKQAVLSDWAFLKVKRGEVDRARELMKLHTAIARSEYEAGKLPASALGANLRWEAQFLEDIGATREAHALREEAVQLESK